MMLSVRKLIFFIFIYLSFFVDSELLWTFQTGNAVMSSPKLSNNAIYIGSTDGYLYSINQAGGINWKYSTGTIYFSSPAITNDGTIYIGSESYYLYAITTKSVYKWSYYIGLHIYSSPAIGNDGTIYVGCLTGNLYAISSDGSLKWKYNTGTMIYSASPKVVNDGTVYIGSDTFYFYAITSTGSLKWKYMTGGSMAYSTPAITNDGTTIYVGNEDGNLYAFTSSGNLKWKYATGNIRSSPVIGNDGTIYIASNYDYVFAITSTGTLKWKYYIGGSSYSNPTIGNNGAIFVGSSNGYLYALTSSGGLKWRYLIGTYVYSSPLVNNNTIYIGSSDGKLYAFDDAYRTTTIPTSTPTATPTINRCPPGTYSNTTSSICKSCPAGYYSGVYGGTRSCSLCSAGYFSSSHASSCSLCQPGSYSLSAASSCSNCSIGTYSATLGATTANTCKLCVSGSYAIKKGSVTPGYFTPNVTTVCQACQSGYYSAFNGASTCTSCPAGSYGNKLKASTSCLSCHAGTYSDRSGASSISSCKNCTIGTFSSSGANMCQVCAQGSYNDKPGSDVCTLCAAGTSSISTKANSSLTCIPCKAGYYTNTPGCITCSICPAGTYSSSLKGSTRCTACKNGTFLSVSGASSKATCNNCSAGYYSNIGASKCTGCATGTYSNALIAATSCYPCSSGTYSNNFAASSKLTCKNCTIGTFSSSSANMCQVCAQGSYNDKPGSDVCTLCAAGTSSISTKANSSLTCIPCKAGYYTNTPGSITCLACSVGSFTSRNNSTECTICSNGTYTELPGSAYCNKCEIGRYSIAIGANSSSTCMECKSGTYTIKSGSTSCVTCSPGYYTTNSTTACQPCPSGYYSTTYGASACTSCPSGKYNEERGMSYCLDCGISTYSYTVAATTSNTCKKCPYNRITVTTGSTSSSDCLNPGVNFFSGILLLITVMVISIVYIIGDRITYIGVFRRKKLVKRITCTCLLLSSRIKKIMAFDPQAEPEVIEISVYDKFKFVVFILLCVCAMSLYIIITLCFLSLQVMFTAVIIWRDFNTVLLIPLKALIENAFNLIHKDLATVLYPFIAFIHLIGSIKLDLAAVNITCQGSQAPAVLLVNILILVIFAFLIESEIPNLITTSFANVNQQLRSYLRSEKGAKDTGWTLLKRLKINCASFASITSFISQNGRHSSTSSCDLLVTPPNIDTAIAIWTTVIGYFILPAIIYIISKLLIPTLPNITLASHIDKVTIKREPFYLDSTRIWYIRNAYNNYQNKIYPIMSIAVYLEPVWVFFALFHRWLNAILLSSRDDGSRIFLTNSLYRNNHPLPPIPLIYEVFDKTNSKDNFEWEDTYKNRLPTYSTLIILVAKEYEDRGCPHIISYFLAFIFIPHFWTNIGCSCWYFVFYSYITFPCVCLGAWNKHIAGLFMLNRKIKQFIIDIEITDENNLYGIVDINVVPANVNNPVLDSETRTLVSSLLSGLVGTRAILFMMLPYCSLLTTFAIATSGYPLFLHCSKSMRASLPSLVIPNSRDIAEKRLKDTGSTAYHSLWIVYFTSWSILVSESRVIQFFVSVTKWFLAVSITFFPNQIILAACFGILAIYCSLKSLGIISNLAILMRVKFEVNKNHAIYVQN